ncbi:MAG: DUF2254 family protein [bacterium]|nr:DUF2254 family protein [bacterium]
MSTFDPKGISEPVEHLPADSLIARRPERKPLVEPETFAKAFSRWGVPFAFLFGNTLVVYLALGLIDLRPTSVGHFFSVLLGTDPVHVYDSVSPFVELTVAILGIMITVIAIVLQLAAQRYGTRLIDLFLEDQINRAYFALMVCTVLYAVFLTFGVKDDFYPGWALLVLLLIVQTEVSLLAPYFLYVFKFLTPTNLLHSIQRSAYEALQEAQKTKDPEQLKKHQMEMANAIEQVTDSALSAVNQMDRNLGLMALNQIREMVLDYQELKRDLPEAWFQISPDYFVGISRVFYDEICEQKQWVEAKAFMDMELIFKNSIRVMPDAVSAIARNTRLLGEEAIRNQDDVTLELVVQFFNTFIRVSVNDKNVRAIFNLFYQYRLLAESIMDYSPEESAKILFYFKYYGETCLQQGLWFVMLTASFDLGSLVATAFEKKVENLDRLLTIFMSLEDNIDATKDFLAFEAIRKSQIILATYIYSKGGDQKLIDMVIDDLSSETVDKLIYYRDALLAVKSKKFWEVTDRGYTFEYMEPEQKEWLGKFFDAFILSQKAFFKQTAKPVPTEGSHRQKLEQEIQGELSDPKEEA